jgi:hypothetical protein
MPNLPQDKTYVPLGENSINVHESVGIELLSQKIIPSQVIFKTRFRIYLQGVRT